VNWDESQSCTARVSAQPASLDELAGLLRTASQQKLTVSGSVL
jgi:hypothetical protein